MVSLGGGVAGEGVLDRVGVDAWAEARRRPGCRRRPLRPTSSPLLSVTFHSSRIQTGTSPSSTTGSSCPQCTSNLRGVLLVAVNELDPGECVVDRTSRSHSLRSWTCERRRRGSRRAGWLKSFVPLGALFGLEAELVAELHQAALLRRAPSRSSGTRLRSRAPSVDRSSTRRSAMNGAVARTPVSPPACVGSCEMRNTSAQVRDLSSPSGAPSSQAADQLVDLLEQHAALQHARRL